MFCDVNTYRTSDVEYYNCTLITSVDGEERVKNVLNSHIRRFVPATCMVGQDKWARATEIERELLAHNVGLYKLALLGTGASCHVWWRASDLEEINWNDNPPIKGIGGITSAEATGTLGRFGKAMLCPEVIVNIISVSQLMRDGCVAEFTNRGAKLMDPS